MNMFRQKADVYGRSQEEVRLEDLGLEITMLSVCVKTVTLGIVHEEGKKEKQIKVCLKTKHR